ncbi:hypothetical protein ACSVDA_14100 [Cytobacillus sp. Hm23]
MKRLERLGDRTRQERKAQAPCSSPTSTGGIFSEGAFFLRVK